MLTTILSGGQTGADLGGLQAGNKSQIETGGWAPKYFLTENGSNLKLGHLYGLKETKSGKYPARTKRNVKESDATLWVGYDNSAGAKLTFSACRKFKKPWFVVPYDFNAYQKDLLKILETRVVAKQLADWLADYRVKILNVAGNRESINTGVGSFTERIVMHAILELKDPGYIDQLDQAQESPKERAYRLRQERMKAKLLKQKKKRRRLPKKVETLFR